LCGVIRSCSVTETSKFEPNILILFNDTLWLLLYKALNVVGRQSWRDENLR
jgi:hypothetical protein